MECQLASSRVSLKLFNFVDLDVQVGRILASGVPPTRDQHPEQVQTLIRRRDFWAGVRKGSSKRLTIGCFSQFPNLSIFSSNKVKNWQFPYMPFIFKELHNFCGSGSCVFCWSGSGWFLFLMRLRLLSPGIMYIFSVYCILTFFQRQRWYRVSSCTAGAGPARSCGRDHPPPLQQEEVRRQASSDWCLPCRLGGLSKISLYSIFY